jgi:hypothetical protein
MCRVLPYIIAHCLSLGCLGIGSRGNTIRNSPVGVLVDRRYAGRRSFTNEDRPIDHGTVALTGLPATGAIEPVQRILDAIAQPRNVGGQDLRITASAGVLALLMSRWGVRERHAPLRAGAPMVVNRSVTQL